MKTLLFSPFFVYGGAEKQFRKTADILVGSNDDYSVLAIDGGKIFGVGRFWKKILHILSVDVKKEKKARFIKLPFFYLVVCFMFFFSRYRRLYCYSLYCLPFATLLKLMSILTLTKIEVVYSERIYNSFVKKSLRYPFLYNLFDSVVVNSDELMSEFSSAGVNNVKIVRNYVSPLDDCEAARVARRSGAISVAIPARINKEKNQLFVVESLKQADFKVGGLKVFLNLYGEIDDEEYFDEVCPETYREHVSHEEYAKLSDIYKNNDVICLPSRFEGTSNVVLESMINKVPIICSSISANIDTRVDLTCLFDFNTEDFIEKLRFLVEAESEEITSILDKNYSSCERTYGVDVFEKEMKRIFDFSREEAL